MLMNTIYLNDTNQVSIICQNCGLEHSIDTTKFNATEKKLEGKCRCEVSYKYKIEFRKRYRESVRLEGEYFIHGIKEKGKIIIRDLSMIGIQFECLNPNYISKDDVLRVKFNLDNSMRSEIRKHVKVIWVKDQSIGARFIETKFHKEDLESYLRI
jgi:hypothetical protein